MNEFKEKLIDRLKRKHIPYLGMDSSVPYGTEMVRLFDAIEIVNQLAEEYNNCSTDISTNADRIRAMSDEELAEYIFGVSIGNAPCVLCSDECDFCELSDEECKKKTLNWLQSEAE